MLHDQMALQGPLHPLPPAHSRLPALYPAPAALFADNLIGQTVMGSIKLTEQAGELVMAAANFS